MSERYWMFVLPPRDKVSGTEDGSLAEKTCARFTGEYDLKLCLTGFGNLAGSFWLMFDFQDGVSYPPDSTEDADIAAKRAVDRCTRHPDPGSVCKDSYRGRSRTCTTWNTRTCRISVASLPRSTWRLVNSPCKQLKISENPLPTPDRPTVDRLQSVR